MGWVQKSRGARAPHVFDEGTSHAKLAWAAADVRTLTLADNTQIQLFFAPACGGKMTYVVATMWPPFVGGEEKAKAWVDSVKIDGAETSDSCKAVREMKDPDAK